MMRRFNKSASPLGPVPYFYLTGQLARTNCAGEAREMCRKTLLVYSCRFWRQSYDNNTATPGKYRSTNDSVMKSERSSLVRGSDLPNSAHNSVGDMWRGPARESTGKAWSPMRDVLLGR